MFVWAGRKQFSQPRRQTFENRQKIQLKVWKKYQTIFFRKKISFVNMFFWTQWIQLSQCRQKVSNEAPKLTRSISRTAKTNILLSQTNVFRKKYGIDSQNAVLTTPQNFFRQEIKNLLLKVRKRLKELRSFHKKLFAQNF